jgi:hypothetical protein
MIVENSNFRQEFINHELSFKPFIADHHAPHLPSLQEKVSQFDFLVTNFKLTNFYLSRIEDVIDLLDQDLTTKFGSFDMLLVLLAQKIGLHQLNLPQKSGG